jgi:long-chain acyl-CoA synthetase
MMTQIGQVPAQAAAMFSDKEALVFGERVFTYNDLHQLTEQAAAGLAGLGVSVGDVVTLYGTNSWQWIVSYYAALRLGAVINPVNTMLTATEVEFVVNDCGAKTILASPDKLTAIMGIEDRTGVDNLIALGDDAPEGALNFDDLLSSSRELAPSVEVDPNALSTICYTSGTTGHPKGAMQSHRAVLTNAAMTAQMHARGPGDCVVNALPLPHVYGNVVMNTMMIFGVKMVLHARFDPSAMLADIEQHKATIADGVPTMYMFLLNHPDFSKTNLSSLTRGYVGGQTMPVATMQAVEKGFGIPLMELWGMTEIAGLGTTFPRYGENKHGSIGCAIPYCEVRIADTEDASKVLAVGSVGELMIRGPIVMMGYYGDDAKTRETLEPDGWLHTGDVAHMDNDGCVFIVDRKKDMIITGGYNVYPAEIERVLAAHPALAPSIGDSNRVSATKGLPVWPTFGALRADSAHLSTSSLGTRASRPGSDRADP